MQNKYIYSLTNENGIIFYIGKCDNVVTRYKRHLTVRTDTKASKYIFDMIAKGVYPELHIMHHLPIDEADKVEMYLIKGLTLSGYYLTNHQFNFSKWKMQNETIIASPISKEEAINIIINKFAHITN